MSKKIEMVGERFGRLVVVEECATRKNSCVYWICRCDCGNTTKPIKGTSLRDGTTKSCGCCVTDANVKRCRTHGMCGTAIYRTWGNMIQRCRNPIRSEFKNYGKRGISVCEDWLSSFEAFHEWAMSHGYTEGLTIDRIDPNGNYCPENCRWVTMKEQGENRRNSVHVIRNGDKKTLKQIADELGIHYTTAYRRYKEGRLFL